MLHRKPGDVDKLCGVSVVGRSLYGLGLVKGEAVAGVVVYGDAGAVGADEVEPLNELGAIEGYVDVVRNGEVGYAIAVLRAKALGAMTQIREVASAMGRIMFLVPDICLAVSLGYCARKRHCLLTSFPSSLRFPR